MARKYGLLNAAGDGIVSEVSINGRDFVAVGGCKSANHSEAVMMANGYVPYSDPIVFWFQEITEDFVVYREGGSPWGYSHIALDKPYDDIRAYIEGQIKSIGDHYLSQPSSEYHPAESNRFPLDLDAIKKGDISRFKGRGGSSMTDQQYVDARAKKPLEAGDSFMNQVIGKRTDLYVALASTADYDLKNFDYKTIWDELADYIEPDAVDVDPDFWQSLLDKITVWKG